MKFFDSIAQYPSLHEMNPCDAGLHFTESIGSLLLKNMVAWHNDEKNMGTSKKGSSVGVDMRANQQCNVRPKDLEWDLY